MRDLLAFAVDEMSRRGVNYGDIRIVSQKDEKITARNQLVTSISEVESLGFGVRVMVNGCWGFASSHDIDKTHIASAVELAVSTAESASRFMKHKLSLVSKPVVVDSWTASYEKDPFTVPLEEKIELLLKINEKSGGIPGVTWTAASMGFTHCRKYFADTLGSYIDQSFIRSLAGYSATAAGPGGFEQRTFFDTPLNCGYEHIEELPMLENAERIGKEAVEKLNAPFCPEDTMDLILLPSHTCLVIHETIGHATELDRSLGWEADFAGTSWARPEGLGSLRYGSDIFNVTADRILNCGRSSIPYDDDGIKTGKWDIISDGILTGFSTTMDTAHIIGESESRGCSYADSWNSVPILRMPNVCIRAGKNGAPDLETLIKDTKRALLMDGTASFSIDQQRINFQFGADSVRVIENGKVQGMLRNAVYQSHNPDFWSSVDAVCGQEEWRPYGITSCGKGQPPQVAQMTHGSAPLRVKNVRVGCARL